jgi:4-carboxymuconolactone decarboxylase
MAAQRFAPLTEDVMTAAQRAVPSVKAALAAGTYNPNGFDAVMLRNPGLQDAINGVAAKVYPMVAQYLGKTDDLPTVPAGLVEIGILLLAQQWDFPAMFGSHGPAAVKEGISQETVDALERGERPAGMKAEEAAVYDFCAELVRDHAVSDQAFQTVRSHLSEREVVDLIMILGVYTNSLMMLKVANIQSH